MLEEVIGNKKVGQVEGKQEQELVKSFLAEKKKELGIQLNEVQQKAVETINGPLLLLASPGSGKTTTIIMRIGYLIQCHHIAPKRIKAVTFSKAAANDLKERYEHFFPNLPMVQFSTIHSLAFQIVREDLQRKQIPYHIIEGYDASQQDYDPKLQKNFILRDIFEKVNGESPKEEQMEDLTTYISYMKNKKLTAQNGSKVSCKVKNAAHIMQHYEEFKKKYPLKLLLDFDDMLVEAEAILLSNATMRKQYKQKFDYILTDESQDTSLIQHKIIEILAEDHRNLCVVADDDQSIYSWRGAEPQYLLQFKDIYPDAQILFMEQNYRSSSNIVEAANAFIKRNHHRYPKNMFTDHDAADPIVWKSFTNSFEEVQYIVEEMKKLDMNGWKQSAVLYRNHASSILLMDALERAEIPFYMKDADDRFFSHWIVEDILNFMRLSYNDRRLDIFEKLHMKMNTYITKQQMQQVKQLHRDGSIFQLLIEQIPLQDYQYKKIDEAQSYISKFKEMTPKDVIFSIRVLLGYDKTIEGMSERLGFRQEYLMGILDSLSNMSEGLTSLEQFAARLKHLEDVQKKAKRKRGQHAVTLSTLHSAKGLEFDRVYMMDMVSTVLPTKTDLDDQDLLEEAARLFYVGMTRARFHLELLTTKNYQGSSCDSSIFVKEVLRIQQKSNPTAIVSGSRMDSPSKIATTNTKKVEKVKNPNAVKDASKLLVGTAIIHEKFGDGVISQLADQKIVIEFAEAGKKTLLIEACITNALIELKRN